ncbi:MAG: radical SAM protein [Oscillospiraceae bacterium]|nr:radical SAM protein [Oscillospiraceae bacterium]
MVQVDQVYIGFKFTSAYLPYAAGLLCAYAFQNETIKETYALKEFLILREQIDRVIDRMEDPYFVGFSCYVWNTEYNKRLAKKIKERFPKCIIAFGGHNVPPDTSFLAEYSYIDFLMHGEGEIPFQKLLLQLAQDAPDFAQVPSLSYRGAGVALLETPRLVPEGLNYPSPYLEGWFDPLFEKHPDIQFSIVWETNRGCPYHCAYCDWALLKAKIRQFPMNRLIAELDWMAEHKIEYVWGADSNFGFFARDEELVDHMIAIKERTGYPQKLYINYAKHDVDRVFRIVQKLDKSGISKQGTTLSFQSLSPEVLKNIGRENMNLAYFKNLIQRYNAAGIRTYSELILGLPGETLQSFRNGIGMLLEAGQHNAVVCYRCVLLPNSTMGRPDMRERFGFRTVPAETETPPVGLGKDYVPMERVPEYMRMIVETNTLSAADWQEANCFFLFVQALHGYGMLRFPAICQFQEKGVRYQDFYAALLRFAQQRPDTLIYTLMQEIESFCRLFVTGERKLLKISEIADWTWPENEYIAFRCLYEKERFLAEITDFLRQYDWEHGLLEELLRYQNEMMRTLDGTEKELVFLYNFPAYFAAAQIGEAIPLEKKSTRAHIVDNNGADNWQILAMGLWKDRFSGKSFNTVEILEDPAY